MKLIALSDDEGVLRLRVEGELRRDEPSAEPDPMAQALGDAGYARRVALSLDGVGFINSSGLGWLLICRKRFAEAGGKMVIHSVPPAAMEVMRALRLDRALDVADDEAAAVALAKA